jgi:LSD1 subclass zinc finger protein
MSETVTCPSCKRPLRVPPDLAGQEVKCPACQATFIPTEEAERLPPADAPAAGSRRAARRDDDYEKERPRRRREQVADHRGVLILLLGLAFFVLCIPTGPFAWWLGNQDLADMRAGRMDRAGEGLTQVGRILGIISTVMMLLSALATCVLIVFMVGMANALH